MITPEQARRAVAYGVKHGLLSKSATALTSDAVLRNKWRDGEAKPKRRMYRTDTFPRGDSPK